MTGAGLAGVVGLLLVGAPGYAINCGGIPVGTEPRLRMMEVSDEGDETVVLVESGDWRIVEGRIVLAEQMAVESGWRVVRIENEAERKYGRSAVLGALLGVAGGVLVLSSGLAGDGDFKEVFDIEMVGLIAGATTGLIWESSRPRGWRCLHRAED